MKMDDELVTKLNAQVNFELYSAYLYLSMSIVADRLNYDGVANWFDVQSQEEAIHATGFRMFLQSRDAFATLDAVPRPPTSWQTPLELFQAARDHERMVSERINELSASALKLNDFTTLDFLRYYSLEQLEEERDVEKICRRLEQGGGRDCVVFLMDREFAARRLSVGLPAKPGDPPRPL